MEPIKITKMFAIIQFLGMCLLVAVAAKPTNYEEETLQLVHVFFRHGSRTPEAKDIYPNDPYTAKDFMPMGWGQLTNGGKQRAYQLGKLLRKRYNHFLGDIYTPDMVQTMSTDYDRTKMSALLVLAGLFPPAPSQKWDDQLPWIPIPYHFEKNENDYFIRRPTGYCPTYVSELDKVYKSEEYKKVITEYADVMKYIEERSGNKMETLGDVFSIYQTLNAEENMNFTLPEWTRSVYPEKIQYLSGRQCDFENYNNVLKRLNGGRMLKIVIEHMISKATGNPTPGQKIFLYSGHENNVINILAALNVFEPHVPKYSAAAIIELHYNPTTKTHYVKVLYERDVTTEPEVQEIPGCQELCEISKFVKLVNHHVPQNYTAECNSDTFLS